jgi:CheY-like chemotaxis protein
MYDFRFLIVEDDPPTLRQLSGLVGEEFPNSVVDVAKTATEGQQCLRSAGTSAPFYHAVILDYKVPEQLGDNPEVNTFLSREAQRTGYPVLIAQITAFDKDLLVQEHIQKTQIERPNADTFHVSKRDPEWATRLMTKLRQLLYTREVRREIDEIFGRQASNLARSRGYSRFGDEIPGGLTHRLADLYRLIEAHWEDLEEDVIERVREILQVDESSGKVRVGLLLRNPHS